MRLLTILLCLLLGTAIISACVSAADSQTADLESRIRILEQKIGELQQELEELRSATPLHGTEAEEPIDDLYAPQEAQSTGNEKLLPDISVVVDTVGTFSSNSELANNDDIVIRGIELGLQGYVYPDIRGDVFIVAEGESLDVSVEEAYATFLRLTPNLSANLGKKFIDFGRINSVHREKWPYVTQPFVSRNLLSPEEGLTGQGVQAHYLLPTGGDLFSQFTLGVWKPSGHHHHDGEEEHEHHLGLGVEDRLYSGRLLFARPVGDDSELELGLSAAGGRRDADLGNPQVRLYGIDLTYRIWPGANKRILFQGEAMRHKLDLDEDGGYRNGYYLFGAYRWSPYDDFGLRYDWSQRPAPCFGRDSGLSAIYTRYLSETTYLRLQLTRERDATTAYLQMVWGLGPHTHPQEHDDHHDH